MKKCSLILFLALVCSMVFLCSAFGENTATVITDRAGLEAIQQNPSGAYLLSADIDLGGEPWQPFAFSGSLDGNGHTLYNVYINDTDDNSQRTSVDGNHKEYETYYAGLFSVCENAVLSNLNICNIVINIDTDKNCFIAGAAGYSSESTFENVTVTGRLSVTSAGRMYGAGGLVGFGRLIAKKCTADVTLVTTDPTDDDTSEEFLGGILACGYGTISTCTVKLSGYASVHGYVHSGGFVGMHHIHVDKDTDRTFWMKGCTLEETTITFFEHVASRRAYCGAYFGENLHDKLKLDNNKRIKFTRDERDDYSQILLPEMCENPVYTQTVTPPTDTEFGYTTYVCSSCGYTYTDCYMAPVE